MHKKNCKETLANYRPVPHLVQIGKLAELVVFEQILNNFLSNDLIHPNHHGSLSGHSSATAPIQIFDLCLEAAEKQELSAVCLLDQSATYDLVCHQTLKEKLRLYSFTDSTIDWVMSYLGDRTQCVQSR